MGTLVFLPPHLRGFSVPALVCSWLITNGLCSAEAQTALLNFSRVLSQGAAQRRQMPLRHRLADPALSAVVPWRAPHPPDAPVLSSPSGAERTPSVWRVTLGHLCAHCWPWLACVLLRTLHLSSSRILAAVSFCSVVSVASGLELWRVSLKNSLPWLC